MYLFSEQATSSDLGKAVKALAVLTQFHEVSGAVRQDHRDCHRLPAPSPAPPLC